MIMNLYNQGDNCTNCFLFMYLSLKQSLHLVASLQPKKKKIKLNLFKKEVFLSLISYSPITLSNDMKMLTAYLGRGTGEVSHVCVNQIQCGTPCDSVSVQCPSSRDTGLSARASEKFQSLEILFPFPLIDKSLYYSRTSTITSSHLSVGNSLESLGHGEGGGRKTT
jgi:hypothetical protein